MTLFGIVIRNLRYYWRQHLGVVAGAALCSMVLVGALMVGDSVKATLKRLADERIGQADLALLKKDGFFREDLADRIASELDEEIVVAPIVVSRGNLRAPDDDKTIRNVQVLGVDERFWQLAPDPSQAPDLSNDKFFVNERLNDALAIELGARLGLMVEKPDVLSREALLSGNRKNNANVAKVLQKKLGGVVGTEAFGRFGLSGNQNEPPTVFVPLKELQKRMFLNLEQDREQRDFANFLLIGRPQGESVALERLSTVLDRVWSLADAGISIKELKDDSLRTIRSRQVFLDDSLQRAGQRAAAKLDVNATGVLTYLVNTMGKVDSNGSKLPIAYSMVTAVEPHEVDFLPDDLGDDEIVLNQWALEDLNTSRNEQIALSYFVVGERRKLEVVTKTFRFRDKAPMPLEIPKNEISDWTPQIPGLSKTKSYGDWNISFDPEDESHGVEIRGEDETYWETYRDSPKAFVTLSAGQAMWGNRWGTLTGLRMETDASTEDIENTLRDELTPSEAGLLLHSLRQDAMDASESPVEFGGLFLGFSFFVIIAAMALTGMLFAFAMEQRNRQAGLLLAVGIPRGKVRLLFLTEGSLLALVGSCLGILLAYSYGQTVLDLLASDWSGAVSGANFDFAPTTTSIALGTCGSLVMALLAMWWATRRQLRVEPRELLALGESLAATAPTIKSSTTGTGKVTVVLAGVLFLAAIGMVFATDLSGPKASMTFFGAGWCLLGAGLLFFRAKLLKTASESGAVPDAATLSRRNVARRSGRSLVTVGAMAAGAFLVIGTGAFRKDSSQDTEDHASGTGGFAFIGETALPVYDDLNSREGREFFELNSTLLNDATIVPLRLREGDDASCLNLNKALHPSLYGVNPSEFKGRFTFSEGDWTTLAQPGKDGAIPAAVDKNTMMWALKKNIGDVIEYRDEEGQPFQVQLAAVVDGSMLQGALYVSEQNFQEKFPNEGGYRGFFVDPPPDKNAAQVRNHLVDRLSDYGLELGLASERLGNLQKVENTYIAIFQALGGLGLLLGTAGLAVVVARNVLERSAEFGLMEAVGYPLSGLRNFATVEHMSLALWGLGVGALSAVVGIAPMLFGGSGQKPSSALGWLFVGLVVLSMFWTWFAVTLSLRKSQLPALRNE